MTWKIVQRFFFAIAGAGTVVLVFSAFLAIWDVFDLTTYWRSLASILVLVFTSLVCAGTAQLLEKYEVAPTEPPAPGATPVNTNTASLAKTLRNSAGMVIISIFFLHGIFGLFAVWNSHDDVFMRVVLSGFTFILGLLVLVAITGIMEHGRKRAEAVYGNLYGVIIILFVLIAIGISAL